MLAPGLTACRGYCDTEDAECFVRRWSAPKRREGGRVKMFQDLKNLRPSEPYTLEEIHLGSQSIETYLRFSIFSTREQKHPLSPPPFKNILMSVNGHLFDSFFYANIKFFCMAWCI